MSCEEYQDYLQESRLHVKEGSDGACLNKTDKELWINSGYYYFNDDLRICGKKCMGTMECTQKCVITRRGYSGACAHCFAKLVSCTSLDCFTECIAGGMECNRCVVKECNGAWKDCTGFSYGSEEPLEQVSSRRLFEVGFQAAGTAGVDSILV